MSEAFKIAKNVPMPRSKGGRRTKYPFESMKPGDSIFLPGKTSMQAGGVTAYWFQRHGLRFKTRTVPGGVRIWRVE